MSYSQFIHGLSLAKIELDRKSLSEIAAMNPEIFDEIMKTVKAAKAAAPTAA
jgi:large subunit ribosomal protein L20